MLLPFAQSSLLTPKHCDGIFQDWSPKDSADCVFVSAVPNLIQSITDCDVRRGRVQRKHCPHAKSIKSLLLFIIVLYSEGITRSQFSNLHQKLVKKQQSRLPNLILIMATVFVALSSFRSQKAYSFWPIPTLSARLGLVSDCARVLRDTWRAHLQPPPPRILVRAGASLASSLAACVTRAADACLPGCRSGASCGGGWAAAGPGLVALWLALRALWQQHCRRRALLRRSAALRAQVRVLPADDAAAGILAAALAPSGGWAAAVAAEWERWGPGERLARLDGAVRELEQRGGVAVVVDRLDETSAARWRPGAAAGGESGGVGGGSGGAGFWASWCEMGTWVGVRRFAFLPLTRAGLEGGGAGRCRLDKLKVASMLCLRGWGWMLRRRC